jgi:hypothetical protein
MFRAEEGNLWLCTGKAQACVRFAASPGLAGGDDVGDNGTELTRAQLGDVTVSSCNIRATVAVQKDLHGTSSVPPDLGRQDVGVVG